MTLLAGCLAAAWSVSNAALGGDVSGSSGTNVFRFECGMAAVTCASASHTLNFVPCGNGPSDMSPGAYVVALLDTRDPIGVGAPFGSAGLGWHTAMWHNDNSPTDAWNARNLGEVFGVTLDDSSPPNIYVAATSIYLGTGRGPGGHGGVYKLSGATYGISTFHSFTNVGSVALGNLCFDREHRQFFVADLDHGLIRRLNMTGAEVTSGGAPYDHGLTGRANAALPTIADATFSAGDLTPSGRRVFGVQTFRSRLYYSVWYAPGTAGPLGYNEIWSTGLTAAGDLVTTGATGPRKELTQIGLAPFSQYAGSEPAVTDIAFSQDGRMLIGERSICTANPTDLASGAHAARAIEFAQSPGWVQTAVLQVGAVGPAGRFNSAGGVDFDCAGHEFVTGDALIDGNASFPYTGNAVYGLQIFPSRTNVVDTSWLVDFDGVDSIYDKLSIGDVEVYRCCDCITFSGERLECVASNAFQWSFCVTNSGTTTNGHLVFLDLPAGVSIQPPIIDILPGLTPGQGFCTNVLITLDPKLATNELCFRVAAHVPDYSECCVVSKCLTVPACCALITHEAVKCDPTTPSLTWCFTLQNLSGVPVKYVYVIPEAPGCVSTPKNVFTLPSPLAPGASTTLCLPLLVTNAACDSACFRIALHDTNLVACCAFDHCVSVRCGAPNHRPSVDCGQPVLLCDAKQGVNFTSRAVVQDDEGDSLTVVWKLDGAPAQTNAIPAGVSATPTPVKQTWNLAPGVHTVAVCVTDGNGAPTDCETRVEVGDQTPPTISCPPDETFTGWSVAVTDVAGSVQATDNCSAPGQIKVFQQPPPGTIFGPGRNCITVTAVDMAGNASSCTTCITLTPLRLNVGGAAQGAFGASTAVAPADLALSVDGAVSDTAAVEYFSNGVSLGQGQGASFQLLWPGVPAGSYSLRCVAASRADASVTAETDPILIYVTPPATPSPTPFFSKAVLQDGRLALSLPTSAGVRCSIEAASDLAQEAWIKVSDMVGDGTTQTIQVKVDGAARFFRIRTGP